MRSYLLFHLNLSFSSIDKKFHRVILKKCYWPLLDISKRYGIKIAIELSGSTLQSLYHLDRGFISALKELILKKQVELVGSGFTQSILPLNQYEINQANLARGREIYNELLDTDPKMVLVNEMCFSQSLIDLYLDDGYVSLITDIDNVQNNLSKFETYNFPFLSNLDNAKKIGVVWADSILFQQLQRYIHGENNLEEYLDCISMYLKAESPYLPIYSNDAEIFNFRPGRFETEQSISSDEWDKLFNLLDVLQKEYKLKFDLPSSILRSVSSGTSKALKSITSARHPIIVKKQPKYNINTWTLTGRGDQSLNRSTNVLGHNIHNSISKFKVNLDDILRLSSSDLRTHITDNRWLENTQSLNKLLNDPSVKISRKQFFKKNNDYEKTGCFPRNNLQLEFIDDKYLLIKTDDVSLQLNIFKGGAIKDLSFASHKFRSSISSLPAGTFEDIEHGVDYFSSLLVAEFLLKRSKQTDLNYCKPFFNYYKDHVKIIFQQNLRFFDAQKIFTIPYDGEEISVEYRFRNIKPFVGYVRVGNFLLNSGNSSKKFIETKLGTNSKEIFELENSVDHERPVSTFISSNSGIPTTDGSTIISFLPNGDGLHFKYDIHDSYAIPMIKYKKIGTKNLFRLIYSLREFDDTAKPSNKLLPIKITISPSNLV